jgi:predicted RNA binding protein YcfA (HicA-like mRNA interferase family)
MSPKKPQIRGAELLRLLQRLGYRRAGGKGDHFKVRKTIAGREHNVTLVVRKGENVAKGTLNDLLKDVAEANKLSIEELLDML